jgi:citrate lyase subunit beta / citryl-CoA lyase
MQGPLRTLLFAPGNHPRKVDKVFHTGTDVVILDLEDAVAISEKVASRAVVIEALKKPRPNLGYVRVNAFDTEYCFGDIHAVMGEWLDGIVLPKVESAAQLEAADWMMRALERERGLEEGKIDLLPIVETGLGLDRIDEIARSGTRVKRLSFGAGDFTRDMGYLWTPDESELSYPRSRFAVASRAARLEPPIDTVFIDLRDIEHFEKAARTAMGLGFQGKLCIHPSQIDICNTVFTPTDAQIVEAKKHIEAFKIAEAEGSASIQVDGYFIDYPIIEKAERILALAAAISARNA